MRPITTSAGALYRALIGPAIITMVACGGSDTDPVSQVAPDAVSADAEAEVYVPKNPPAKPQTAVETREEVLKVRAERRYFEGAAPVIPHTLGKYQEDCLACHQQPASVKGVPVPGVPHGDFQNCRQCHLDSSPTFFSDLKGGALGGPPAEMDADFHGLGSPGKGQRYYPDAPPRRPHTSWMRENCTSCHGKYARKGLETPHFNRQSCTQCHVGYHELDQRDADLPPAFPTAPR